MGEPLGKPGHLSRRVLILAIIVFGMVVGGLAQLVLGQSARRMDWGMALVAGLVGSLVGGLLVSLLAGDGLDLHPSGIIGSVAGAVVVTAIWQWARTGSFSWSR
jgi:uncharacterized membrane protein YeaQ/YmgE (transglycosylase-associated protein family)